jgi:hypothetical protein
MAAVTRVRGTASRLCLLVCYEMDMNIVSKEGNDDVPELFEFGSTCIPLLENEYMKCDKGKGV